MNTIRINPTVDYYFSFSGCKYNLQEFAKLVYNNELAITSTILVVDDVSYKCGYSTRVNYRKIAEFADEKPPICFTINITLHDIQIQSPVLVKLTDAMYISDKYSCTLIELYKIYARISTNNTESYITTVTIDIDDQTYSIYLDELHINGFPILDYTRSEILDIMTQPFIVSNCKSDVFDKYSIQIASFTLQIIAYDEKCIKCTLTMLQNLIKTIPFTQIIIDKQDDLQYMRLVNELSTLTESPVSTMECA